MPQKDRTLDFQGVIFDWLATGGWLNAVVDRLRRMTDSRTCASFRVLFGAFETP